MKRLRNYISLIVVVVISLLIMFISPYIHKTGFLISKTQRNLTYEEAIVKEVKVSKLQPDEKLNYIEVGYQQVTIQFTTGKYKGQNYTIQNPVSRLYNTKVKENTKVVAAVFLDKNTIQEISIYSYKRNTVVIALVVIFFAVILLIGRLKGLKSIVALIFTLISIVYLMIPLMFRGVSPIVAATLTAVLDTLVTLYLISGYSKKTLVAILGTTAGVIISGLISYYSGELAHLSGLTMENAENMLYIAENSGLKVNGLMFAAILIASLGAAMDIGMSIASAVYEVHRVNTKLTSKELFKSGINIGQDMIGTMSNTLILAFVGGSMTLMIMLLSANISSVQLLNLDVLCTEFIQGLSGSIGIILTVPLTALLASFFYKKDLKKYKL